MVLGILSLLVALLLPALQRARATSRESACATNLRQVGAALLMYLADYDDTFPYAIDPWRKAQEGFPDQGEPWYADIPRLPTFPDVMKPYLADLRVLSCPSDTGVDDDRSQGRTRYEQYGMSYTFADSYGLSGKRLGDFPEPARTSYMDDIGLRWHLLVPRSEATFFEQRGSALYLDGHVKLETPAHLLK